MDQLIIQITNKFTKILSINEIKEYPQIYWGGNGVGNRFLNKKYNYSVIYKNKKIKHYIFSDNIQTNEIETIIKKKLNNFFIINKYFNNINNGIVGIFIINKNDNKIINRTIRKDIIDYYRKIPCVICGSNTDLVCDHKNDLYNDMRALDIKTQRLDDFQSLCNHCNLQKREICKKEIQNKKIYIKQLNLLQFQCYKFKFFWENKEFDEENIYTKYDTFWYDPVEYQRKIYFYTQYIIPLHKELLNIFTDLIY